MAFFRTIVKGVQKKKLKKKKKKRAALWDGPY